MSAKRNGDEEEEFNIESDLENKNIDEDFIDNKFSGKEDGNASYDLLNQIEEKFEGLESYL